MGNTTLQNLLGATEPVHPHIRGEYTHPALRPQRESGSSPHPWGIQQRHRDCAKVDRFIPTSVGNTPPARPSYLYLRFIPTSVGNTTIRYNPLTRFPVHPHIRGEYPLYRPMRLSLMVLSHIRGEYIDTKLWNGLTPAVHPHIRGEYEQATNSFSMRPVHPHIRGEYIPAILSTPPTTGSSPHPWGILLGIIGEIQHIRFIPTSVGNTSFM